MGQKVVVGLSGGVDSSVAAWLLKEQGYDVIGVTLLTWGEEQVLSEKQTGEQTEGGCFRSSAAEDAERVAESLEIPHHVVDFSAAFQRHVIDYFVGEYLQGHTPNPCTACNRYIKWEALMQFGRQMQADFIATGHYARIERLKNGRYTIAEAAAVQKDQTYALYNLTQEQLAATLLPLGAYTKGEVRAIAEEEKIPVAHKPDSQEICFVPDDDYVGFIEREAGDRVPGAGNFVTADGTVLGRHKGIAHYTIGQRRGLSLPMGRRVFVTDIRPETNEVVLGENEDLFTELVYCDRVNYMAIPDLTAPRRVLARIRYHHRGEFCTIEKKRDGIVQCRFEKPVRAAAPGQAVVFYEEGHVLGGGTIL